MKAKAKVKAAQAMEKSLEAETMDASEGPGGGVQEAGTGSGETEEAADGARTGSMAEGADEEGMDRESCPFNGFLRPTILRWYIFLSPPLDENQSTLHAISHSVPLPPSLPVSLV